MLAAEVILAVDELGSWSVWVLTSCRLLLTGTSTARSSTMFLLYDARGCYNWRLKARASTIVSWRAPVNAHQLCDVKATDVLSEKMTLLLAKPKFQHGETRSRHFLDFSPSLILSTGSQLVQSLQKKSPSTRPSLGSTPAACQFPDTPLLPSRSGCFHQQHSVITVKLISVQPPFRSRHVLAPLTR